MTLAELLERCRHTRAVTNCSAREWVTADAVIQLFGGDQPCGVEPFEVIDGELVIGDTQALEVGGRISPTGARELGTLLLHGADEAER